MSALPDLSTLGNYPLLQFMLGLAAIGVVYITWVKGMTAKAPPANPNEAKAKTEIYLDGPITQLLQEMRKMSAALERAPVDRELFKSWCADFQEEFSEVKGRLFTEIDRRVKEEAQERHKLDERVRFAENKVVALETTLGIMRRQT